MLTLSRRINESITIGENVEVIVLGTSRGRVRLGIVAPRDIAVYRTELVESIEAQNKAAAKNRAVTKELSPGEPNLGAPEEAVLVFPRSLFGLAPHDRFLLCEVGDHGCQLRSLVSTRDPNLQLLVVDALEVWPNYPIEDAKRASGLAEDEVAVAAVCTLPADGSVATVNLKAPIVIGLSSRVGVQVILDREELGMFHELVAVRRAAVDEPPAGSRDASGEGAPTEAVR